MSVDPAWTEYHDAAAGQRDAARPRASAFVAANAGSGKTKVLIDRVARLLLLPKTDPASILCVTYTKAAASEMQGRLFERLGGWCVMDDAALRADLEELAPDETFDAERIAEARRLFARALETPGGLRIETIHAFCGRLLRRFPLEAGVAPGFQELDDEDAAELWDAAFRKLGASVAQGDAELMAAARIVAEAGGFDVLRALDSRRTQVQAFIAAHRDIDAAAEGLRQRIGAPADTVETLVAHAVGDELPVLELKALAGALPTTTPTDAKLAETLAFIASDAPREERYAVWRGIAFTQDGDMRKRNPYTAAAAKAAPSVASLFQLASVPEGSEIARIRLLDAAMRRRRLFDRSAALLRVADAVFANFAARKRARGGLDFDDLIHTVGRLLTAPGSAEWVLWKLDGGVRHVLLDEAQDTSPGQWTILRSLTADIFAGHGAARETPRTLFVVGDQKQSIYSFQGADPEHFLRQSRELEEAARIIDLAYNTPHMAMSFRSVGAVLRYVDAAFDPAAFVDRAPFSREPPQEADHAPHTPFRRAETGCVELWALEDKAAADEPDPWDAPVDQQSEASPKVQLARRIAAFIRREIDTGAVVWERGRERPARPGDFLILVKQRKGGLFDAVLQQLKRARLPVAGADRIQLLDSLPVQDMLNLVRFALHPDDDLTLAEILKGPFGGLDDDALFALAHGRTGTLWRAVRHSGGHDDARTFLEDVLARRHQAPFEFLSHALERPAGLKHPGWELILSRFDDPAREPVTALMDRAAAFDASSAPSLQLFLAAIEQHGGEVKRELSEPRDEVRVMTVHGAKGLQAPVVILPDTTSAPRKETTGLFVDDDGAPLWAGARASDTDATGASRTEADAAALREHRRLLYVALTRAQDRLVVCGAWHGKAEGAGRDPASWYALCEAAMDRLASDGGDVAEIEGDGPPGRRHGPAPARLRAAPREAAPAPALPGWVRAEAPTEAPASRIVAPSALGGEEPPALAPFAAGREGRLRRGRLIHTLLQALPELAPAARAGAAAAWLARQPDLTEMQQAEMAAAALGVLADPQFAAVFSPEGRAETPVVGRLEGRIINGRVDRLVVGPGEVLIVDFKTDRPAPPSVADIGEAYRAQMAAYRAILAEAWPGRTVKCLLVWTDGPKLMEIPAADLDSALKRALR
jgi:ATP-dependent helicase/nuclease subunit A